MILALILGLVSLAFAGTSSEADHHGVIYNIGLCVLAAGGLSLLIRKLKLPTILAYLLAGVLLGPLALKQITDPKDIHTISEIGLIILLFMIGLEMDLKKMLGAGKWVILPGLIQFPLSVLLTLAFLYLSPLLPLGLGDFFSNVYISLALALSSTMIVVKILYETKEINSLAGRIALGILIFQDIWAIIVLAIQPQLAHPELRGILSTFVAGFLLVAGALALSRYVLPPLFRSVDKQPEVVLVLSLAWCFLVSLVAAHPKVGLSMEMGALIAGVSLGTFPYNHDITARVVSLRDFFITLFFVALGLQITWVHPSVVIWAAIIALSLPALRLLTVFVPLRLLKAPTRAGLEASVHLSQMSEFSLVILAIAAGLGQIDPSLLSLAVWIFAFGAVFSGLVGQNFDPIQKAIYRWTHRKAVPAEERLGKKEVEVADYDVLFLGLGRIGRAFIEEMIWYDPELCQRIGVIDVNIKNRAWLESNGVHFHYGDLAHPVTFNSLRGVKAKIVVSGIPDAWLKGSSNTGLLRQMRRYFPDAYHVINTSSLEKSELLYSKGAHHVLIPEQLAGHALSDQVRLVLQSKQNQAENNLP